MFSLRFFSFFKFIYLLCYFFSINFAPSNVVFLSTLCFSFCSEALVCLFFISFFIVVCQLKDKHVDGVIKNNFEQYAYIYWLW